MRSAIVAYKTIVGDIFSTTLGSAKKEKRSKKERKGRPVETAAAVEIGKGGLRRLFLMISTAAWKSLRKKRSGFSTVTTGPTAINNQPRSLSFSMSHGWGAVQSV
jgi:hypothetical protein